MTNVEWQAQPSWDALLISVGAYRHHPALRSRAVETRQLEAVLADPDTCGFAKIDRLDDPTAEQARQAVTGFLARHSGGAMLIYFTGHGKYDFATGRLHLLTADSPSCLDDDLGLSVTDDWLMRELANVRGDDVFVVLDVCFTGVALTWQVAREVPYGLAFRPMAGQQGFHTLAAAGPVEPAGANTSGLPRLTHALIEVLRDGSAGDETGLVSVARLCEVAAKRIAGSALVCSAHPRGRQLHVARRPPEQTNLAAVRRALANHDYATVRRLLRPVKDSDNGDYRYYMVLGLFAGHRPNEFATDDIRRAEVHLAGAATGPPHLCALWALIREDHYGTRGIDPGSPTVEELIQRAREIDPVHAAEIVIHLPAPECQTWVRLRNRAQASGV
jgi:hypothetical protein